MHFISLISNGKNEHIKCRWKMILICVVCRVHTRKGKIQKKMEVNSLNWGSDPISLRLDEFKMNVQSDRFFFFALLQMYLAS